MGLTDMLRTFPGAAGLMLAALIAPTAAFAADSTPSPGPTPTLASGLYLNAQDAALSAGTGKEITFFVDVLNNTSNVEHIHLSTVSGPQTWQPTIEDGSKDVSELMLLPGKDDSLTFNVTPPNDVKTGQQQQFTVKATTDDGLSTVLGLTATITNQTTGALQLTTNYPILHGDPGSKFEFTVTIANNTGKDQTFNLASNAPSADWQVSFQPTAATTDITSLAVKSGSTQDVHVEVTAPQDAKPDEYPLNVTVSDNAGDSANTALKVGINGKTTLDLNTPTQQLSADATAGRPETVTLLIKNTGNAAAQDVNMAASDLPNGWKVDFNPRKVDSIDPGTTAQVQAIITPSARAAAGDYVLNVSASNQQTSVNKDFRVTTTSSSILGWIGIAVVVVVVGGLVLLVAQGYSRR